MKWAALLKDIKEKVGLTPIPSDDGSSASPSSYSHHLDSAEGVGISAAAPPSQFGGQSPDSSYERFVFFLFPSFDRNIFLPCLKLGWFGFVLHLLCYEDAFCQISYYFG